MTPPPKGRSPTGEHIRVVETDELPIIRDEEVLVERARRDSAPGYQPVTRDDVTDHALLPRRFDLLASEMRDLNEHVRGTVGPALKRIEERQEQERTWATRAVADINARLDEIILALGVVK